jgi:hypothetical protein
MRILLRTVLMACLVGLHGCASNVHVHTSPADRTLPNPGGTVSGGAVELRSPMTSLAVVLFGLHLVALVLYSQDIAPSIEVPALDPSRSVSEQDCTQPVPASGGNLRCR